MELLGAVGLYAAKVAVVGREIEVTQFWHTEKGMEHYVKICMKIQKIAMNTFVL